MKICSIRFRKNSSIVVRMAVAFCCIRVLLLLSSPHAHAQEYFWNHQDSIPNLSYQGIACADGNDCMAMGSREGVTESLIRKSTDGGLSWRTVWSETPIRIGSEFLLPLPL
ncbi:MAG: hypothetical protein ABI876_09010, partial [Bacteroidota bacterium]